MIPPCKNDAEHKRCFAAAKRYFWETYQIEIDQGCKDVSRKCFLSYDPDLWHYENVKVLDVENWQLQASAPASDTATASDQPTFLKEPPPGFTKAELKRSAKEWLKEAVEKILDAAEGERHKTIFGQSRLVGQFCPHTLERKMAENKLLDAALKVNPRKKKIVIGQYETDWTKVWRIQRPIRGRSDHSEDEEGNKQIQFLISRMVCLSKLTAPEQLELSSNLVKAISIVSREQSSNTLITNRIWASGALLERQICTLGSTLLYVNIPTLRS